jgi:Tol biopolymer transport system component
MFTQLIISLLFAFQSTDLVSSDSNGTPGNATGDRPSSSANGDLIVFESSATNLVFGDTNQAKDLFLKTRSTGSCLILSRPSGGGQANGDSILARISADGRFVCFKTWAQNLIPGGYPAPQPLLLDRSTGTFEILARNSNGTISVEGEPIAVAITPDGRFLIIEGRARDLDLRDAGLPEGPGGQLFIRDLHQGLTRRITRGPNGEFANKGTGARLPNIVSADGRFVVFESFATNLVLGTSGSQIFIVDTRDESIEVISKDFLGGHTAENSGIASISRDGRYVAFQSYAPDLVPGDTNQQRDVFRWDRITGEMERVSVREDGSELSIYSYNPMISPSGRFVTFESYATDLVPGDTNIYMDCFRKDMVTGEVELMSLNNNGEQGDLQARYPYFAGSSERVMFETPSTNFGGHIGGSLFLRTLPTPDSDGDLISDDVEITLGTDILDRDTDDDGLSDWEELMVFGTSPLQPDSDGDLLWDGLEAGRDAPIPGDPGNGIRGTDVALFRPDLDPLSTTSPADADSDEDGLLDGEEDLSLDGVFDGLETDPFRFDTDGDGLSDGLESGVSSRHPDTDLVRFVPDLNPATTTSPILKDTDGGGMPDGLEDINGDGAFQFGEFDPLNSQDDRFDLTVPPLIAGTTVVIEIDNARPGSTGVVAYSLTGSGPSPSGRGFDLELSQPIELLSTQTLFLGHGEFIADIPSSAPSGMPVWLQGIEQMFFNEVYRTSNLVATTIQ